MPSTTDRQRLGGLLKHRAEFLKIKENSKAPVGSFRPGKRNRYKRIPKEGNYGIIPEGNLFVLDMDVHKGGVLEEQIPFFSKLLGIELKDTLTVKSPSGGLHFYLTFPLGATTVKDFPKTNLRSFQSELCATVGEEITIDADIRSDAVNAYVLGPGSKVEGKTYRVKHWGPILEITEEGLTRLASLRSQKLANKFVHPRAIDLWASDPITLDAQQEGVVATLPPESILEKLTTALKVKSHLTYHQKRAFVKAALHCCYSNDAIAKACMALDIHKDSSSGRYIGRYALQQDIHSLEVSNRFHGPYCLIGQEKWKQDKLNSSQWKAESWAKVEEAYRVKSLRPRNFHIVNPRVVDVSSVAQALLKDSKRGVKAKQYAHAMLIMESIIQPLANVGANKFLLSQNFLVEQTGLTPSQVAQALRLLRANSVLELSSRQRQGVAPVYALHRRFVHRKLTYYLKRTWLEAKEEPLLYKPRTGGFVEAFSGKTRIANSLASAIAVEDKETLLIANPEIKETTVVETYLKVVDRKKDAVYDGGIT